MGEKHLPELIFVVVLVFSYDSIILENIYVFYHIFRLFIGNRKPRARRYSTRRGLTLRQFLIEAEVESRKSPKKKDYNFQLILSEQKISSNFPLFRTEQKILVNL